MKHREDDFSSRPLANTTADRTPLRPWIDAQRRRPQVARAVRRPDLRRPEDGSPPSTGMK